MSQPTDPLNSQENPEEKIQQLQAELDRVRKEHEAEKEEQQAIFQQLQQWQRRWLLISVVTALLLVFCIGGFALWIQRERAKRAAEDANRQTIENNRLAMSEAGIRQAIKQARKTRGELHAQLRTRGGVFKLLNNPFRWQGMLKEARAELQRAEDLSIEVKDRIDAKLLKGLGDLGKALQRDETDHRLAIRLEKIREDRANVVDGEFDFEKASMEYRKIFREAGLEEENGKPKKKAAIIRQSAIAEQLRAALDDWAMVAWTAGSKKLAQNLLEKARLADPDPLREKLRDSKIWRDHKELEKLLDNVEFATLSPQILARIGKLLEANGGDAEAWLRKAVSLHPDDFSLNHQFANVLASAKPEQAAAFYRAALAIRPASVAVWKNLAAALHKQKKLEGAIEAYRKAIQFDPSNENAWDGLGQALKEIGQLDEAIQVYQKLLALASPAEVKYFVRYSDVLQAKGQLDQALEVFRKAIKLESPISNGPPSGIRFLAARAAILRAAGMGNKKLDKAMKQQLRAEAFQWLRSELVAWQKHAKKATPEAVAEAKRALRNWQKDPVLANVRGEKALSQLSEPERNGWQKLWTDIAILCK